MGEATGTGGAVFSNLEIRRITPEERAGMWPRQYGMDFGFSLDPSALMETHFRSGERELFILDEYCKAGAGLDAMEKAIRQMTGNQHQVWSDTDPRVVAELHGRGVKIAAARKGRGSRSFGMQWLEELPKIVIDPVTCPNAAREFSAFEHGGIPAAGNGGRTTRTATIIPLTLCATGCGLRSTATSARNSSAGKEQYERMARQDAGGPAGEGDRPAPD